jgi:2-keto-4-pentenoate hydratase
MTAVELRNLARSILRDLDARQPGRSVGLLAGLTVAQAYALQQFVSDLREQRGESVIGYKLGCTSPAIQEQLGIGQAIFARLFQTRCFPADLRLAHKGFANPAVEGELAIRLSRDLPHIPLSDEELIAAIASIFPVIELHHYVVPANGHTAASLIASGGMHAGLVLADRETKCDGHVPAIRELEVVIDGRAAGRTGAPWTMGGPAATLRFLSVQLAGWGLSLRRGQVILAGSALPLYMVGPGTRIVVEARPLGRSSLQIE